ncbi:uncharacterized protein CcaverHIS019_0302960 [Cutaneotrichosporon cavernicola]|uniref:Mid2 domain-containing protein n=1 Tax=Cutaneotrichosporon cavernicola TaxID=279322 RepID=A0AA48IF58_9TREE|nr:uncharacterized protein CcaverHIS019_0302960 [Cutaneotrichosporon cavernicola]BEI90226.1 hypothetical protein CcaverHIS019_0302960 [Cutaneotrichosporon cavernicola]BEI98005.1 hypothetical protein CcaverHIS631_0303040 [Cutaneotrichosporon cavernicola]BEJ05781.1 hypothetical protein CcaverHIS641_0303030 [Cutaneotrichosporon cavernicola]
MLAHLFGLAAAGALVAARPDVEPRDAALGCPNLYTFPTASDNVELSPKPVTFTWDTSCKVGTDKVDLFLYIAEANKLVKAYQGIAFSDGKYEAQLMPAWWNNTESTTMYVNLLKNGGMAWDTTWARGPDFKVTYDKSKFFSLTTSNGVVMTLTAGAPSTSSDTVFESVSQSDGHKVSKAVIAVAVIIPIVIICILGAVWFFFYRQREKKKLQRWSQALSQASNMEWEKGALPGERNSSYGRPSSHFSRSGRPSTHYSTTSGRQSMAFGRPSMSSTGRPTSSVMLDNMAGAGAGMRAMFPAHGEYGDGPTRSSIVLADGTTRQSRISFADQPRPSLDVLRQHIPSGLSHADSYNSSAVEDSPKRGSPPVDPFATRSSLDALRDTEAAVLYRMEAAPEAEAVEALEHEHDQRHSVQAPAKSPSQPAVAYGPDQMLAVYAQRGKVNASPVNTPTPPPPAAKARPSAMKRLMSFKDLSNGRRTPTGRKTPSGRDTPELPRGATPDLARGPSPDPESVPMRSLVHLNNGVMSKEAVDAMPRPGPGEMRSMVHQHTGVLAREKVDAMPKPGPPESHEDAYERH